MTHARPFDDLQIGNAVSDVAGVRAGLIEFIREAFDENCARGQSGSFGRGGSVNSWRPQSEQSLSNDLQRLLLSPGVSHFHSVAKPRAGLQGDEIASNRANHVPYNDLVERPATMTVPRKVAAHDASRSAPTRC